MIKKSLIFLAGFTIPVLLILFIFFIVWLSTRFFLFFITLLFLAACVFSGKIALSIYKD